MGTGRTLIYIITTAGLLLPFILITDLYPFFRLGMFAEPARQSLLQERYELYYGEDSSFLKLNPNDLSINPNNLHYLIRNYYYRHEGEELLKKIAALKPEPSVWRIYSFQLNPGMTKEDSTILVQWRKH
jgi:hypothetical protein